MAKVKFEENRTCAEFGALIGHQWFLYNRKDKLELYMKIDDYEAICMTDHKLYDFDDEDWVSVVDDSKIEITVRD